MSGQSSGTEPILCAHLLRRVDEKLVDLLGSLEPSQWNLQTIAPMWKVRDVAAHLVDTALRKLSMVRDSCCVEAASIRSPEDLITLVNRLNQEGVTVFRRLSPKVLIAMMKEACKQSARFHEISRGWLSTPSYGARRCKPRAFNLVGILVDNMTLKINYSI